MRLNDLLSIMTLRALARLHRTQGSQGWCGHRRCAPVSTPSLRASEGRRREHGPSVENGGRRYNYIHLYRKWYKCLFIGIIRGIRVRGGKRKSCLDNTEPCRALEMFYPMSNPTGVSSRILLPR